MSDKVVALRKEFGKTVAADIAHRMREEILTCRMTPGEPLKFEALRASFGASFTTLREALMALVADGLVFSEGQRGFHVAPVSAEDLTDLTNARVLIEVETLRKAMTSGGDEWEIAVMSTLHRLTRLEERIEGRPSDDADWRRAHSQFHHALVSACGSPTLLTIRAQLFDRSERYRSLSSSFRPFVRDKVGEHRAIMLAAIGRDQPLALDLIEKHIRVTTENVLKYAAHLFGARADA
jgi:GntR family transcriptional regulator, carbon starvation induced regulator